MRYEVTAFSPDQADIGPGLRAALVYWRSLTRGRRSPAWRDVDMMQLPLDLVPWCSVFDVINGGENYIVRFLGTERVKMVGAELTGKSIHSYGLPEMVDKLFSEFNQVVTLGEPIAFETKLKPERSVESEDPQELLSYINLRMPFSDGEEVNLILNMVNYSVVPKELYEWFGTEPPLHI